MSDSITTIALSDDSAKNEEELGGIYYDTTQQQGVVGDWTGPHTVTVRGPFETTTAVVLKRGSSGYVAVFEVLSETDHRPIVQYNASDGAVMIIIEPGYYCWIMEGVKVRYVE
ncbi:hypothetical protein HIM_11217 [Hirsutella minnesotensis 3608]|uniref:Uncharacterized protein n=1 Tax=Hirsutella minnesotensis 3608 TaxID=1043627 RepID=A0A0F7ZFM5_9HYPO|nr:hypothetical protein HIM_11217 [Hirsutella minnesotensis 3608]